MIAQFLSNYDKKYTTNKFWVLFSIVLLQQYILMDILEIKEIPMATVLVIDDSPSEMAKFRDMLAKNNFQVL
ncbi:hypothetical protein R0J93_21175, partial [Pseudoalteromonas sp. SIMBA_148]